MVILVRYGSEPVGLLYAKEKTIGGFLTGVVYGDGTLENLALAKPEAKEAVFRAAFERMLSLRRFKALRLLVPPEGPAMRSAVDVACSLGMQVSQFPIVLNHARLALPATYDAFLNSVGYRTRRNFRYYRRQFEAAGHCYVAELSMAELRSAALGLRENCRMADSKQAIERICSWLEALNFPFACGLKSAEGKWLSLSAGFRDGGSPTMVMQLNNDQEFERESLSAVLRAYLIESLIQQGVRELVFWAGVGGALARYVEYVPGTALHVDSQGYVWSFARTIVRTFGPRFPKKLQRDLEWIAPSSPSEPLPPLEHDQSSCMSL
jgi:hypothetical protein